MGLARHLRASSIFSVRTSTYGAQHTIQLINVALPSYQKVHLVCHSFRLIDSPMYLQWTAMPIKNDMDGVPLVCMQSCPSANICSNPHSLCAKNIFFVAVCLATDFCACAVCKVDKDYPPPIIITINHQEDRVGYLKAFYLTPYPPGKINTCLLIGNTVGG